MDGKGSAANLFSLPLSPKSGHDPTLNSSDLDEIIHNKYNFCSNREQLADWLSVFRVAVFRLFLHSSFLFRLSDLSKRAGSSPSGNGSSQLLANRWPCSTDRPGQADPYRTPLPVGWGMGVCGSWDGRLPLGFEARQPWKTSSCWPIGFWTAARGYLLQRWLSLGPVPWPAARQATSFCLIAGSESCG